MSEGRPDDATERPVGFRAALSRGEDTVDVATWAGAIPAATGIAPRVRIGSRWFNLLWLLPIGFVLLIVAVAVGEGTAQHALGAASSSPATRGPLRRRSPRTPAALPIWVGVQHFFNLFLLIFIIRSGLQILSRPSAAVLDPAQHAGQGLVPDAEAGARPIRSGRRSRTRSPCPARSGCRASGTRSGWPAGGTWASTRCGCSTASSSTSCCSPPAQWRRLVPTSWEVLPERRLGADPVPVAGLADRDTAGSPTTACS